MSLDASFSHLVASIMKRKDFDYLGFLFMLSSRVVCLRRYLSNVMLHDKREADNFLSGIFESLLLMYVCSKETIGISTYDLTINVTTQLFKCI